MSAAPESKEGSTERPAKFGPYAVVRELARGGMALVFEGRHPQLGSRVALKVMQPALAAQPMAAARFLREAKAASQIRHQNVVEVFDVGTEEGVPFIVMEFLDGSNLATLLAERGAMPLTGIVDVFLPVMSAVATAHRVGVIHRDLKPANLMITSRAPRGSQAMVLDFGISKVLGDEPESTLTRSESLLGTVQYMAPELTKGAKFATPASDQYAIGVMLYECATGRRPFTGDSYYDMMHAIVTAKVIPPSELNASLPPEFDDLVLRAMSRDPAGRFPSVQALASALLSFGDKRAWALWEDEFCGTSDASREPWSVGPSTLNDGATLAPPRRARWRRRWWMGWALGALAFYAAVVTAALARRPASVPLAPPADVEHAGGRASAAALAPEPVPPASPAPRADNTVVAPPRERTSITAAPIAPAHADTTNGTDRAGSPSSAVPLAGDAHAMPINPNAPTRGSSASARKSPVSTRASASAAPIGEPPSSSPAPTSTVGTNGAPIVE
jgi:serine/threonine-protein kinase